MEEKLAETRGLTPLLAERARLEAEATEPSRLRIAAAHGREAAEKQLNRYLNPDEAAFLGVPVGSRVSDVAGRVPPIRLEAQARAFNYGSRALAANQVVEQLEATGERGAPYVDAIEGGISKALGGAGTVIGSVVGGGLLGAGAGGAAGFGVGELAAPFANMLRSGEAQQYYQAKLDFIMSVLRKESGAAVSAGEFDRENRRYFPQPGDSATVVKQKARSRQVVLRTFQNEAGRPLLDPERVLPETPQGTQAPVVSSVLPQGVSQTIATLIKSLSPREIMRMPLEQLRTITSAHDIPGLTGGQRRALAAVKRSAVRTIQNRGNQPRPSWCAREAKVGTRGKGTQIFEGMVHTAVGYVGHMREAGREVGAEAEQVPSGIWDS